MTEVYRLIGEFQDRFREYLAEKLDMRTLNEELQRSRDFGNRNKLELASFKQLVLSHKSAFLGDFGKKAHNLPTWLDDLTDIRNKVAHYEDLSLEDKHEAVRLIRKISELANLSTTYLDRPVENSKMTTVKKHVLPSGTAIRNPELDRLVVEFPSLTCGRTQDEYRIYKEGAGRGSIWIARQRGGYRIVTTGVVNSLRSDIESLTGKKATTMRDRDHLKWKGISLETLREILKRLQKL